MSQRIGDNNDGLLDSWSKRVRVLGLNPTMPNDLIASMLFSIVFLGLLLGCGVVCRQRAYRSTSIYILSVGTLLTFLGFAIRAGISTSQNPTRLSFVFESMFLIIGEICILDVWIMRARDELLDGLMERAGLDLQGHETPRSWLLAAKHNWETRVALASRLVILPLCLLLYIIAYSMIHAPLALNTLDDESLKIRGGASFLVLALLAIMDIVLIMGACLYTLAWFPVLLLFLASIFLWLPGLYAFCLVTIALDSSDLVDSKAFFNAGFGFGHASVIAILLFLTRRAHLWSYREPAEGEVVEEELIVEKYAYVPTRWIGKRHLPPQQGEETIEAEV